MPGPQLQSQPAAFGRGLGVTMVLTERAATHLVSAKGLVVGEDE